MGSQQRYECWGPLQSSCGVGPWVVCRLWNGITTMYSRHTTPHQKYLLLVYQLECHFNSFKQLKINLRWWNIPETSLIDISLWLLASIPKIPCWWASWRPVAPFFKYVDRGIGLKNLSTTLSRLWSGRWRWDWTSHSPHNHSPGRYSLHQNKEIKHGHWSTTNQQTVLQKMLLHTMQVAGQILHAMLHSNA